MSAGLTDDEIRGDAQIRQLYDQSTREVDAVRFAAHLYDRLAGENQLSRRGRERESVNAQPTLHRPGAGRMRRRRLGLAATGLIVALAVGLGAWQLVDRLGGSSDTFVFGDAVDSTETTAPEETTSTTFGVAQQTGGAIWERNLAEDAVNSMARAILQHFVGGEDIALARAAVTAPAQSSFDEMVASLHDSTAFQILGSETIGNGQVTVQVKFSGEATSASFSMTTQVEGLSARITAITPISADSTRTAGDAGETARDSFLVMQSPGSLSSLTLAGLWRTAAEAVGIDYRQARLDGIQIGWYREGGLAELNLSASVPDGRRLNLWESAGPGSQNATVEITCEVSPTATISAPFGWVVGRTAQAATVLQVLDEVGLQHLVDQMGEDLDAPPTDPGMAAQIPEAPYTVRWALSTAFGPELIDAEAVAPLAASQTVYAASKSGVHLVRTAGDVIGPVLRLSLGRTWQSPTEAMSGESRPIVLSVPGESAPADTVPPQVAGEQLDGLAFGYHGVWRMTPSGAAQVPGVVNNSMISYSLGGSWLIAVGNRPNTSDSPGQLLTATPVGGGEARTFLDDWQLFQDGRADCRYDETHDRIWVATTAADLSEIHTGGGDRHPTLWTVDGPGEPVKVDLQSDFGGQFDVSPDGSRLVYLGRPGAPARVVLRANTGETDLKTGLTTAYHPAFSPDGSRICLAGSKDKGAATALWIYDMEKGTCVEVAATEGLVPTHPVFAPDGKRVAFRGFWDGRLWVVDLDSQELASYVLPLTGVDTSKVSPMEGPLAW